MEITVEVYEHHAISAQETRIGLREIVTEDSPDGPVERVGAYLAHRTMPATEAPALRTRYEATLAPVVES